MSANLLPEPVDLDALAFLSDTVEFVFATGKRVMENSYARMLDRPVVTSPEEDALVVRAAVSCLRSARTLAGLDTAD
jgi:hypothetical protein